MMNIATESFGQVTLHDFINLSDSMMMRVLDMRNHPQVREQMHNPELISKENHLNFINSLKNSDKKYFVIERQNKLVGTISFTAFDTENCSAELGIYANLEEKTEKAGSILMEAAFSFADKILSLEKIVLEVYEVNQRAFRLYEKFGFTVTDRCEREGRAMVTMEYLLNPTSAN